MHSIGIIEVYYKLFPYNQTESREIRILIELIFHGLAALMTIGLLALLIGAEVLG